MSNFKFKTHIYLVSGQQVPNFIPVLSEQLKPEKVILLASADMKENAGYLQNVIEGHQVKCEIKELTSDIYSIEELTKEFEEIIEEIIKECGDKESLALNITGGRKTMTIAAQQVAYFNNVSYFYVQEKNNEVSFYLANEGRYESSDSLSSIKLGLKDYLAIHGYSISEKTSNDFTQQTKGLRDFRKKLLLNYKTFSDAIAIINKYASIAEKEENLTFKLEQRDLKNANVTNLLDDFIDNKVITKIKDNQYKFTSEATRFFANGGWLEDEVFEIVRGLKGVQDYSKNIEITTIANKTKNEIDVAFLFKNRLYIIECKTRRMDKQEEIVATNTLYKLDSVSNLGSLTTKAALVSFQKLSKYDSTRAQDLKIKVFQNEQLHGLKNQISSWMDK